MNSDKKASAKSKSKILPSKTRQPAQIKKATDFNNNKKYHPKFVKSLKTELVVQGFNKASGELPDMASNSPAPNELTSSVNNLNIDDPAFEPETTKAVMRYQYKAFGQSDAAADGMIGFGTYSKIKSSLVTDEKSENEQKTNGLIGNYTEKNVVLIPNISINKCEEVTKATYDRCVEIAESAGDFSLIPDRKNVLAIRGAYLSGKNVMRSGSAAAYLDYLNNGSKEPADPRAMHFWSKKNTSDETEKALQTPEIQAQVEAGFDDVFISFWQKDGQFFAIARQGSVDPNLAGEGTKDGTAHLRDGQYDYKVETHRTTHGDHMRGIMEECSQTPSLYNALNIQLSTKDNVTRKIQQNLSNLIVKDVNKNSIRVEVGSKKRESFIISSIKYKALKVNKSGRTTEVYREKNGGVLTPENAAYGQEQIANQNGSYRDKGGIGINIHTSSNEQASSAGCQNIPIGQYADFMSEITSDNNTSINYVLIDASKIKA